MANTFSIRLNDNGALGCNVRVLLNGVWHSIPRVCGDGHGAAFYAAWDNREQAIKAARKWYARQK